VLRLARGLRLLRLVTALPRLQLLVGALLKSLGAMGYVTLLLALMFYIYGVAGVHLFGGHDARHFGSLSAALVSLFRMITLDNWSDIFNAARAGAPLAAALYFVSFILLGTMIMLNLFIGIIMNSMSEMHAEIEERDRARHVKELGRATLADDFNLLEQQTRRSETTGRETQDAPGTRLWAHWRRTFQLKVDADRRACSRLNVQPDQECWWPHPFARPHHAECKARPSRSQKRGDRNISGAIKQWW